MRDLNDLSHTTRPLPGGGEVLILDTGALVEAETQAMLAARYSRSVKGALTLIEDMFDRDVGKFMRENYQAGYGHKSIAELGDTAIFVDGISMLAAKAIQDFPLYRGQESSTRYIDFSKQRFVDPADTGTEILERWRAFHLEGLEVAVADLMQRFPRKDDQDEAVHRKAIKARAFDIMRAFLPAGATTNVAWVGDLRHVNDHLATLRNHPLAEVRGIALSIEEALLEKFPNSFSIKRYEATEKYLEETGAAYAYYDDPECPEFSLEHDGIDRALLTEYEDALRTRPEKTELPFSIRECGTLRFAFTLDFGSFRDLQRHRALITRMPLLTDALGFEEWYLSELPEEFRARAESIIAEQLAAIRGLGLDALETQYYLPMGMKTPIRETGDLRAYVYFAELRATRFVHPTLRVRARQVASTLTSEFANQGLVFHLDPEPDEFDVKRGEHDIVRKA